MIIIYLLIGALIWRLILRNATGKNATNGSTTTLACGCMCKYTDRNGWSEHASTVLCPSCKSEERSSRKMERSFKQPKRRPV